MLRFVLAITFMFVRPSVCPSVRHDVYVNVTLNACREAIELSIWRRRERISWSEEEVLQHVSEKRQLISTIRAHRIGHVLHHDSPLGYITQVEYSEKDDVGDLVNNTRLR